MNVAIPLQPRPETAQSHAGDPDCAPLIAKLSRYLQLRPEERAAIAALAGPAQRVERRRDLMREGQPYGAAFLLCAGTVSRYRVLPDGRRQVLDFGVPGDLVGFPSCQAARAPASVCCLTECSVAQVPTEQLSALFLQYPRLGAALFWSAARDASMRAERLVAVGRRSAEERVAYLFLELIALHAAGGLADGDRFRFPITQELIADAVGLSTAHVNRTLRRLRETRLLTLDGQDVEVPDARGLITLASFDPAHFAPCPIPGL